MAPVAQLPDSLILYILSLLPPSEQVWSARRASKAAHAHFPNAVCSVYSPDLPFEALQECCQQPKLDRHQTRLIRARINCGDLAGTQWLYSKLQAADMMHIWPLATCEVAAGAGHLEILKWAGTIKFEWSEEVCTAAAAGGHMHILQWARAQKLPCPWSAKHTCAAAAGSGHLAVLQWLRSQNPPCPWTTNACRAAAGGGHLAVLQWARQQKPRCPWGAAACSAAAAGGKLSTLQWLRSQQPPCP